MLENLATVHSLIINEDQVMQRVPSLMKSLFKEIQLTSNKTTK
jgi:hypothetical protein